MILFFITYHHSCPECGEVPIITMFDVEFAAIQQGLMERLDTQGLTWLPPELNLS